MASSDESLKTFLSTFGKPVYVLEKPDNVSECVIYKRVSNIRFRTQSGFSGLSKSRYQIEVYGSSYSTVHNLMSLIVEGLDGNKTDFICATVENNFELKDIDTGLLYWSVIDCFIWN